MVNELKEKNKPRVALLVILIFFSSIMVYSLNTESLQDIEVEEGHSEMTVKYPEKGESISYYNTTNNKTDYGKGVTAITYIDGKENTLELSVYVEKIISGERIDIITTLIVRGDIDSKYPINTLKLIGKELDTKNASYNYYHGYGQFLEESNLTMWQESLEWPHMGNPNGNPIYYDINGNDFFAKFRLDWTITSEIIGIPQTTQFKAVIEGDTSRDIETTVMITIEGEEDL